MKNMAKKFAKTMIVAATMVVATLCAAGAVTLPAAYTTVDANITSQIETHEETMSNAHTAAEAFRAMLASGAVTEAEANAAISSCQATWQEAKESISALKTAQTLAREVTVPFGPHSPSGLSAAAFNKILEGTALAGTGESFAKMEAETGTNGLFAIGVTCSESSYGSACYYHNPFGILGSNGLRYYASWDEAIMSFGKLIASSTYSKATTIEGINSIYCPGDGGYWSTKVRASMNACLSKIAIAA